MLPVLNDLFPFRLRVQSALGWRYFLFLLRPVSFFVFVVPSRDL